MNPTVQDGRREALEHLGALRERAKPLTFGDAFEFSVAGAGRMTPVVSSVMSAVEAGQLWGAANRTRSGTETPEDDELLLDFAQKVNRPKTGGYKFASVALDMVPLAGEIFAGLGIAGAAGKQLSKTALGEVAMAAIEKNVLRGGARALAARATVAGTRAASLTGTVGLPHITAKTFMQALPDMALTEDEAGAMHVALLSDVGGFLDNLPKGAADQFIEYASELSGAAIVSGLSRIPVLSVVVATEAAIMRRLAAKLPGGAPAAMERLANVGWRGPIGEVLEEVAGAGARELTPGLEGQLPELPEIAAIFAMSPAMLGASAAINTVVGPGVSAGAGGEQEKAGDAGLSGDIGAPVTDLGSGVAPAEPAAPREAHEPSAAGLEALGLTETASRSFPGGRPVEARSELEQDVVARFNESGVSAVLFEGSEQADTRPAATLGSDVVGINVEALMSPERGGELAFHEFIHVLRKRDDAGFEELYKAVASADLPGLQSAEAEYDRIWKAGGGAELTPDQSREEGLAYRAQVLAKWIEQAATPEGLASLEAIAQKDPSLWARIVAVVRRMLGIEAMPGREAAVTAIEIHQALQQLGGRVAPFRGIAEKAGESRADRLQGRLDREAAQRLDDFGPIVLPGGEAIPKAEREADPPPGPSGPIAMPTEPIRPGETLPNTASDPDVPFAAAWDGPPERELKQIQKERRAELSAIEKSAYADEDRDLTAEEEERASFLRSRIKFTSAKLIELGEARRSKLSEKRSAEGESGRMLRQAARKLGLTTDPREAGYIRPDGSMLDFSGKREGGPPGNRAMDHREIAGAVDGLVEGYTEPMLDFMAKTGAVRMHFTKGFMAVDFSRPLTPEQKRAIMRLAAQTESVSVDANSAEGQTVFSEHVDPADQSRVARALRVGEEAIAGNEPRFAAAPPTESPEFKRWFKGSKVVDPDGEPLVVFHGTRVRASAAIADSGRILRGYFTKDPGRASGYAISTNSVLEGSPRSEGAVIPVYLSIQNPAYVDEGSFHLYTHEMLDALGYDGAVDTFSGSYIIRSEGQIKSATGNRGTFDPESPDIRFAAGEPRKVPFVRRTDSATDLFGIPKKGAPFDREFEPSGEYFVATDDELTAPPDGALSGTHEFASPLVVPAKGWKRALSGRYAGLTGRDLSRAIIQDGYDAVLTEEADGSLGEGVNLQTFDYSQARYAAARPLHPPSPEQKVAIEGEHVDELDSLWTKIKYWGQDTLAPVEAAVKGAAKRGAKAMEGLEHLRLWRSIAMKRTDALVSDFLEPIAKTAREAGISLEKTAGGELSKPFELLSAGDYLVSLHVEERNKKLAERTDQDSPSGYKDEWARKAKAHVAALSAPMRKAYERVGELHRAMRARVTQGWIDDGLSTEREVYDLMRDYPNYITLASDLGVEASTGVAQLLNLRSSVLKSALGRTGAAESPLAASALTAAQSAVVGESMRALRRFATFIKRNPEFDLGAVNVPEVKRGIGEDGQVTYIDDPSFQLADNVIEFREGGERRHLTINPSYPLLARALQNATPGPLEYMVLQFGTITRTMAALSTRWNPLFPPVNFLRDVVQGGLTATADAGPVFGARVMGGAVRHGLQAMYGKGKWAHEVEGFERAGGRIAHLNLRDLDDQQRELLAMARESGPTRRFFRALGQFFGQWSDALENATRLSAFIYARDTLGMSESKAAVYSKQLTTNFETRGALGNYVNSIYAFANAAEQSTFRLGRAIIGGKHGPKLAGSVVVAAVLVDFISAGIAGEDDDGENFYDKIPDYTKRSNIILPDIGGGGSFSMIPAPHGWRAIAGLGTQLGHLIRGSRTVGEVLSEVATSAVDSFSPIGGGIDPVHPFVPTAIKPLYELQVNKSFTGRPISPAELPFGGPKRPDSERAWRSTSPFWRGISRITNAATGGDEFEGGLADVSPETFKHLVRAYGGGLAGEVSRSIGIAGKFASGEDIKTWEVPGYRRFRGTADERLPARRFREYSDALELVRDRIEAAVQSKDPKKLERVRKRRGREIALLGDQKRTDSLLRRMRRIRDATESEELLERVEAQMDQLVRTFNRQYIRTTRGQ